MSIKKFKENEIPYEKLEKVGLTRQMIEDLPEDALSSILAGQRSPVLPLLIAAADGQEFEGRGRFSLYTRDDGEVALKIHPVLKPIGDTMQVAVVAAETGRMEYREIPTEERYSQDVMDRLNEGRVVLDFMYDAEGNRHKAFLQLDRETNEIIGVPTQQISRNLRAVSVELNLTPSEDICLQKGELVSYTNDDDEMITLGLDLNSPTGVRFAIGDERKWNDERKRDWDKYELGINGCWMTDDDGNLQYVSEDEFDEYDIWNEVEKQRELKRQGQFLHRGIPLK